MTRIVRKLFEEAAGAEIDGACLTLPTGTANIFSRAALADDT